MRIPLKIKPSLRKMDQINGGVPRLQINLMEKKKNVPHIFRARVENAQSVIEDLSEKTVASPNYKPPTGAKLEKRKSISFNSPHNLGGRLLHFIFPAGGEE